MEIETRDFGKVDINKEDIILFNNGIPGFPDYKEYVLLPLGEDSPFVIMQSVEEKELAFILIKPWDIVSDYEFEISNKIEDRLKLNSEKELLVFVIASIHDSIKDMTVNLAAPLVINHKKGLGKQVILDAYPVRYPVLKKEQADNDKFDDKEQVAK